MVCIECVWLKVNVKVDERVILPLSLSHTHSALWGYNWDTGPRHYWRITTKTRRRLISDRFTQTTGAELGHFFSLYSENFCTSSPERSTPEICNPTRMFIHTVSEQDLRPSRVVPGTAPQHSTNSINPEMKRNPSCFLSEAHSLPVVSWHLL